MQPQSAEITPEGFLKTLSIIHFSLLSGMILFMVVAYIKQGDHYFNFKNTGDVYIIVVPMMAIAAYFVSRLVFKQQILALASKDSLKEKLMVYQGAALVRLAFLEGAALFGIVAFMITGNLFELLISILLVLYFLTLKPTKEKVINDLQLSQEQRMQF
ncbi:MAG: hypothetical protein ACOH2A_01695 [Sphingobacteriaceae bacterium]